MITAHTLLKCKSLLTRTRILGFRFRVWGQGTGKEGCWRFGYEELQGNGKILQECFWPKKLTKSHGQHGSISTWPTVYHTWKLLWSWLTRWGSGIIIPMHIWRFNLQSLHPLFRKHYLAPLVKETLGESYQFVEVFSSVWTASLEAQLQELSCSQWHGKQVDESSLTDRCNYLW